MVAELPVRGPDLAVLVRAERQRIDEHGLCAEELDVEGGGVREGDAALEALQVHVEVQERCVLQRMEAPFVGIRDEGQLRMLDDVRGARGERA